MNRFAGGLRLALGRRTPGLAVRGGLARISLTALGVLALGLLLGSLAPPAWLSLDTSAETLESEPGSPYQTPFGSIADDIRLMPLEKSLSRTATSLRGSTSQQS